MSIALLVSKDVFPLAPIHLHVLSPGLLIITDYGKHTLCTQCYPNLMTYFYLKLLPLLVVVKAYSHVSSRESRLSSTEFHLYSRESHLSSRESHISYLTSIFKNGG